MYTVTGFGLFFIYQSFYHRLPSIDKLTGSSGIVSERRFEQVIRMNPPQIEMALGQIGRHSATVQSFFLNTATKRQRHSNNNNDNNGGRGIATDCSLNVLVQDASSSQRQQQQVIVFEKSLALKDNSVAPLVAVDGLKPFQHYTVDSQVFFTLKNFFRSSEVF
jgi:hypothetical protein